MEAFYHVFALAGPAGFFLAGSFLLWNRQRVIDRRAKK